jgi:hypothetical protein
MRNAATEAGYEGASYASLGGIQREMRAALATARESGDQPRLTSTGQPRGRHQPAQHHADGQQPAWQPALGLRLG